MAKWTRRPSLPPTKIARWHPGGRSLHVDRSKKRSRRSGAILGLSEVGAGANFFEIGGHSLIATQVISRLRDALRVQIPLRALFESPTIASLAERIEVMRRDGDGGETAPILSGNPVEPPLLSFSQEALWFLDCLSPGLPTFNTTAALRISGPFDIAAFERSLKELTRRHESLRTTFVAEKGTPHQVISHDVFLSIERIDLTDFPAAERVLEAKRRAIEESSRPFDLARGPLSRVCVVRLQEDEHDILLTIHHIVTDGWSLGVAASELATLYRSERLGLPSQLPELPIRYADFARWQREQLQSGAWASKIACWNTRLAGVPVLDLPLDRPRPPIRTVRGALHPVVLSPDLSDAVLRVQPTGRAYTLHDAACRVSIASRPMERTGRLCRRLACSQSD